MIVSSSVPTASRRAPSSMESSLPLETQTTAPGAIVNTAPLVTRRCPEEKWWRLAAVHVSSAVIDVPWSMDDPTSQGDASRLFAVKITLAAPKADTVRDCGPNGPSCHGASEIPSESVGLGLPTVPPPEVTVHSRLRRARGRLAPSVYFARTRISDASGAV